MREPEQLYLELEDDQWPFRYTDHDLSLIHI